MFAVSCSIDIYDARMINRRRSIKVHFNENPIYVLPEKELRGLSPNVHIYVSASDLYTPSTLLKNAKAEN
jgi:hypothetical protein